MLIRPDGCGTGFQHPIGPQIFLASLGRRGICLYRQTLKGCFFRLPSRLKLFSVRIEEGSRDSDNQIIPILEELNKMLPNLGQ
jgi:hypothetical protein